MSIANLGVNYYHNAKGWMTGAVFDLWLSEWNRELYKQKRKITLLDTDTDSNPDISRQPQKDEIIWTSVQFLRFVAQAKAYVL